MKKIISMLLCAAIILSMAACGSGADVQETPEPGSTHVQETPEPDMASPEPDMVPPEPDMVPPEPTDSGDELTDRQKVLAYMVGSFLDSDLYKNARADYENNTAEKAGEVFITDAMEYQINDMDGRPMNVMFAGLSAKLCYGDAVYDSIQLLVDMETGEAFSSINASGAYSIALNCFFTYTMVGNEILYSELESYETLSQEDIDAVNAFLQEGNVIELDIAEMTGARRENEKENALAAAVAAAEEFCTSEAFTEAVASFEEQTGTETSVSIGNAIFYRAKMYGYSANFVLFRIDAGVAVDNGFTDNVLVLVDLDNGGAYDTLTTDIDGWLAGFTGECRNWEDVHNLTLSTYMNYAVFGSDTMAAPDTETITGFDDGDLAELNDAINK